MELLRSSVLAVLLASAAASLSRVEPKAPWVKDPFGCNLPCWETCLAKPGRSEKNNFAFRLTPFYFLSFQLFQCVLLRLPPAGLRGQGSEGQQPGVKGDHLHHRLHGHPLCQVCLPTGKSNDKKYKSICRNYYLATLQTLAAIVALTMPVEFNDFSPASSCNPFFFSQYIEFGGFR